MFQYSDSFQVFVKADCVIHKTISKTGYRRPRIPFITYLLFQTARPEPADLCEKVKAVSMLSDNLDRRRAASFGVIGYRSDSVKPKITEKCIFYIFFTISRKRPTVCQMCKTHHLPHRLLNPPVNTQMYPFLLIYSVMACSDLQI